MNTPPPPLSGSPDDAERKLPPDGAGHVLYQLYTGSRVLTPPQLIQEPPELLDPWLAQLADEQRRSLGPEPPALVPAIARQATYGVAEACRLLASGCTRQEVETLVAAALPREDCETAAAHYSADLAWRFLPDLWALARRQAPLLVAGLARIADAWPLSSVGAPLAENAEPGAWFAHPCLQRLYLDRIFRHQAWQRLSSTVVAQAFAADLGLYRELAPGAAPYLQKIAHSQVAPDPQTVEQTS